MNDFDGEVSDSWEPNVEEEGDGEVNDNWYDWVPYIEKEWVIYRWEGDTWLLMDDYDEQIDAEYWVQVAREDSENRGLGHFYALVRSGDDLPANPRTRRG